MRSPLAAKRKEAKIMARTLAAVCWNDANENSGLAGRLFTQRYKGPAWAAAKRHDKFCKRWGVRSSKKGTTEDKQRPGRPLKVQKPEARRAAKLYMAGVQPADVPFTSINQALRLSQKLRSIAEAAKCKAGALLRAIKRSTTRLITETIKFKPPLSKKVQAERYTTAQWDIHKQHNNPTFFKRTIYADSHKMPLPPKDSITGAGDRLHPRQTSRTHPFFNSPGGTRHYINYYAAVNKVLGPVALIIVTGTTSLKSNFKVSRGARWCAARRSRRPPPACYPSSSATHLMGRP